MIAPAYQHTNPSHEMVITTAVRTPATVRQILTEEFGYEVVAVLRGGEVARIVDNGVAGWAFIFTLEEASIVNGCY